MPYLDYSMSVGAAEAYDDGERPSSKFTRAWLDAAGCDLTVDAARRLAKTRVVRYSSRHHTSKEFNWTFFYRAKDFKEVAASERELEKMEPERVPVSGAYKKWGDYGDRSFTTVEFRGEKNGDWIEIVKMFNVATRRWRKPRGGDAKRKSARGNHIEWRIEDARHGD